MLSETQLLETFATALRPARRPSWQSLLAAERASRAMVSYSRKYAELDAQKSETAGKKTARPARRRQAT